jgi:transcription initiation factor IIE alpha subunit
MSGHLSVGDRWRIISLSFDQGMTSSEIVSIINCTSRTVRNVLRLFRETNNVIEREGRGRTLLNNSKQIQDNIIVHRMIGNFMHYQMI